MSVTFSSPLGGSVRGVPYLLWCTSSLSRFSLAPSGLRAHPALSGLRLPHTSCDLPFLSLYADDMSIISSSGAATRAVFDVYAYFASGTGAKLNLDKCEGLWLGLWVDQSDAPVAIQWMSGMIRVLGVFLENGDLVASNWKPCLEAVSRCLLSL